MRRKRILISGYYGFSNIGDEAILLSIDQALRTVIPEIEITVLSAKPWDTEQNHGLRAISRMNFIAIWRELRRSDLLISGGGSLFQDLTSSRSLYLYLWILALSFLAGCPVMIYAQGIGPLKGRINRWLTATLLRRTSLITVRDKQSLEELDHLGVREVPRYLTADPVMALQHGSNSHLSSIEDGGSNSQLSTFNSQLIGVSIRPWQDADRLLVQLSSVLTRLIAERGAKILLIPMHYPGDDQITSELYLLLNAPDSVSIFPKGRSVEQVIAAIGELDLLIGVRLHALVFAAIATTPAIAISYDPKVDQFAERMEQVNIGPLSTVSAEAIWQEACYHLDEGDKIRERTRRLSTKLRLEALHNATLAAELLAKGDFQPPQPSS